MSRRLAYILPFIIGFALAGLLLMGLYAEQDRHVQKSRLEVFYKLSAIRSGFESGLGTRMNMAEAVKSFVVLNPDLSEQTFASIAHGLFREVGGVKMVLLARANKVSHVVPLFGKEQILDRSLLSEFPAEVGQLANIAIESRAPQISRPILEARGDEVMYTMTPIFIPESTGRDYYWGMVVVVLETKDLYREAGLATIAPILDVAVREPLSYPGDGATLHGRAEVFQLRPVIMDIPVPGGYWQLGAAPAGGWTESPNRFMIIYGGGSSVLVFVILLFLGLFVGLSRIEERKKYQYLVQNARSIILRIDLSGDITFCNEHAEQFYGYGPGELIGKPLIGTLIPKVSLEGESMKRYLNRLLQDPSAHPFNENVNLCKNGEMVWVAWANQPVLRRDGTMVELLCVGTDITDRKLMEEALKGRERQYRMLAENVTDIIIGLDANLHYTYVSPSDEALRGFERHDVLGRPVSDFLTSASSSLFEDTLQALMMQITDDGVQPSSTLDIEFSTASGSTVWLETRFVLMLNEDRELIGVQGVGRDISDRKRGEALREDVERMAQHDLKTPLGAVVGLPSEILRQGNLNEAQEKMLATIEDAGEAMLHLINRSLDLFKMESGTYVLNAGTVDVLNVLEHIKNETRSIIRAKGISVGIEVKNGAVEDEFTITAEHTLFRAMLANLLVNALQASPNGGTVTVTLDRGEHITITITNKGEVFLPLREKFFEKYASGNTAEGSGLGTYSARLTARTHGGDITLDTSTKGETSIIVTLPV